MKKIVFTILMFFCFIGITHANTISKIDMNIHVDNNGTASITETWDATVTEGTEGWHPYYNLGRSEISDLKVTMDGTEYTTVSYWNVSNSFSEKNHKAGIYDAGNGEIDLCFGISSYGHHIYTLRYKISNFVSSTTDADIIYWNLFPYDFSAEPQNVTITVYSDFAYKDDWDVWGYGKYGAPCYIYDGKIEMTSDGPINKSEYLTLLAKFPKGTFNTTNELDGNFDKYLNMANKGATNYEGKKASQNGLIQALAAIIPFIFSIIYAVVCIGIFAATVAVTNKKKEKLKFGTVGNKVKKDIMPFREIPCNKDIFRAYWVADSYNLNKKKEDFLGAVILKWLNKGNIRIEKVTNKGLFKEKTEDNIIFENKNNLNELEIKLYNYMFEASKDGKLESGEFTKWCSSHYGTILTWFDSVLDHELNELVTEGKAIAEEETTLKIFKTTKYSIDPSMMEEAEQMAGLKKFLKEFTLIKEREPIEVKLWNEYLMYASIFGIADEVASQFKKLYPEVITDMNEMGYNYNDVIFIHNITSSGIRSASTAQSRAQSYSSGGGGFSSGGGGGGSFGGGGGGGGFR